MTIIYWTASWFMGIWLAARFPITWTLWILVGLVGLVLLLLQRDKPAWRLASICLIFLSLGALRTQLALRPLPHDHASKMNGTRNITLTGVVIREPEFSDLTANLVLAAEEVEMENGSIEPVSGLVLVHTNRYPEIAYGMRLRLTGALLSPVNKSRFDYGRYLAQRDIYSEMKRPKIVILETGLGHPLQRGLLTLRVHARQTINRLFSEPQAALLNGILLGYDRGLPRTLSADFQATGTTHIIAISGFNMAIIAGILLRGSRYFFSPRAAGLIAISGIVFYTVFVGAEPSVVRAAIMASMLIVALIILGRPTFLYASLFAAALFMTLFNPLLLWDVGFQLSFMAVLGLMLYVGPWSKRIHNRLEPRLGEASAGRATRMLADVFLATMAAILMTLPIMLFHFRSFSLISPVVNLLILPAQPGIMILGGLATILGMIIPFLGQIPAWAAWLLLTYTINTVHIFAGLPFSFVDVSFPAFGVIVYGGVIGAVTWASSQGEEKKNALFGRSGRSRLLRLGIVTVVFGTILTGIYIWDQPDGMLHVTFFDVGQGDAIFIETPKGRQIVVDGGRYASLFLDKLGQKIPFWDKDINIMVASHPDEDHSLGLADTFDHYQVDLLLVNGEEVGGADSANALLEAAGAAQTTIHQVLAGEVIDLGDGVQLEILHPGAELDLEAANENSLALRLVYGDFAVLLTGDAEEGAEQMMIASGRPLQAAVFKAGHHGSRSSSSRAFLQAVRPQIVVISAGKENKYGHPHAEVLQRAEEIGAAVLRTDEMGSIEIISDGQQIWFQTEK